MRSLFLAALLAACSGVEPVAPSTPAPEAPPDHDEQETVEEAAWTLRSDHLVVSTPDTNLISVVEPSTGAIQARLQLEGRAGDHPVYVDGGILVSLRDERAVALFEPVGEDGLREVWRVEVGPEPRGVHVDVEAGLAWVAVSMQDRVVAVDLETRQPVHALDVTGHPRWLTPLPSGDLLVTSLLGEHVHVVEDADVVRPVLLPELHRENGSRYTMRVTGAPAVDAEEGILWVPTLYVDVQTPIQGEIPDDVTEPPEPPPLGYYVDRRPDAWITQTARFHGTLVRVPLSGRLDLAEAEAYIFASSDGWSPVRGMITGVMPDPSSELVYASVEGARTVFLAAPGHSNARATGPLLQVLAAHLRAPTGPRALWHREGQVWVYGFIDRTLAVYDTNVMRERFRDRVETFSPTERYVLSPSVLGRSVEVGRELFFSSINPHMVLPGGGLSCATCHVDGGTDGLTWPLEDGPRQTPSLVGGKSEQVPVTWTRSVPTVADEVLLTAEQRMGGEVPDRAYAEDTAIFLDTLPVPDTLPLGADLEAIARGERIFEGSAGCAACHRGAHLTDRLPYDMVGIENVRTPTLLGIAATAPYFHDGSAATLRDVVERAEDEGMGFTNHLSEAEKADLTAYLRSL